MHSHTDLHTDHDHARLVATLSYFTVVGWLAALCLYGSYKSSYASFHLRQALGLIITAAILSFIPLIGWALLCVLAFYWIVSIIHALRGDFYQVPLLGLYFQQHFTFIR